MSDSRYNLLVTVDVVGSFAVGIQSDLLSLSLDFSKDGGSLRWCRWCKCRQIICSCRSVDWLGWADQQQRSLHWHYSGSTLGNAKLLVEDNPGVQKEIESLDQDLTSRPGSAYSYELLRMRMRSLLLQARCGRAGKRGPSAVLASKCARYSKYGGYELPCLLFPMLSANTVPS